MSDILELVTGHAGHGHISGDDLRQGNAGLFGPGCYTIGGRPTVAMNDANTVSIGACELLMQGGHFRIKDATTVTIENGAEGAYRSDLIMARYELDNSTGVEDFSLVTVTGTPSDTSAGAVDPSTDYTGNNILNGDLIVDIPLVRVRLSGLTPSAEWLIRAWEPLFEAIPNNAGSHNAIFRGADISSMEASGELYKRIADGSFEGIFIGDYFRKTVDGTEYTFRIAELDRFLRTGDQETSFHHAVVIPDGTMGSAVMNSSNVTTGGYIGSAMRTNTLAALNTKLENAFGTHFKTHRDAFSNSVSDGKENNGAWYDAKAELLNEDEAYGKHVYQSATTWHSEGASHGMLQLFKLAPRYRCIRAHWWLRSVCSAAGFCNVGTGGSAANGGASNSYGVRPRFLIG